MPVNLNPISTISAIVLTSTGSYDEVSSSIPYSVYKNDPYFVSGAVDQVSFVYHRLGGAVLDIEITRADVYVAYDEAVREYSYLINTHQAANILLSALGYTTGTFDQGGEIISGSSTSLMYPKFDFGYARKVASAYSSEANVGGDLPMYSASIPITAGQQDYDLQEIIGSKEEFSGSIGNRKILIKHVYYKTPSSMWRFFGFYGHFTTVGNYNSYGQYSNDSTFFMVPVWQNKLQAIAYEDALWTRTSHYSYELVNNKLRLFPIPSTATPHQIWVKFMIPTDPFTQEANEADTGLYGVNNINTIPFANIPYQNINSIGKQWIKQYALAICKEILGQVRGKLDSIPLPKGSVKLNSDSLLQQAAKEKEDLRKELMDKLDKISYTELAKQAKEAAENTADVFKGVPLGIYVG